MTISYFTKKVINHFIYKTLKDHVNITKTLLINFAFLPFKQAVKLPIVIYGPCKIGSIMGQIKFLSPVRRGMLKIGLTHPVRSYYSKSFVSIAGLIEVGERTILRKGINLEVGIAGHLVLKDFMSVGHNCTIICHQYIEIGEACSVGNNSYFIDSDFHHVINTKTRKVGVNHKPVILGPNCWIGGWCTIKKGTQLPKGTIVAGPNSMVGKNFVGVIPECCMIGGSPAKLLVEGVRRVNNDASDKIINKYIEENGEPYFVLPNEVDIDAFCMPGHNMKGQFTPPSNQLIHS